MSTPRDTHAQHMALVELQQGLSRLGRADADGDTLEFIAYAFLAQNFWSHLFGRLAQQTGATELERHRVPGLGLVRVHRRMRGSPAGRPLCERILAHGGTEFCDSREALLAGYLERGRYLVLYLDVQARGPSACTDTGAGGNSPGDTAGLLVHPETVENAEPGQGDGDDSSVGDTAGLLLHPETVEYVEFMERMHEKPVGWSARFAEVCSFLPADQPLPMRVGVVSWEDIELRAPEPPIPVVRPGAPPDTRHGHIEWHALHFWTSLFQGNTMRHRQIERIQKLYDIVLVDLFEHGALAERECHALTGLQLPGACESGVARQRLLDAIRACQVAPMNVGEHNYHAWVKVYDEDKKRYVVLEPAASLFPHAELLHTRYNRRRLEQLVPGIYAKLEPPKDLCERMQAAVYALRAYLDTAQASDDPAGPPIIFAGRVPLELYADMFEQLKAAAYEGKCCMVLTRLLLAYMRAWGYRARACVGSLAVRLPGRGTTLLYGTGRVEPQNLRDLWDELVARHADMCPERAALVQRLLAEPISLDDFMATMYPKHLLRWALPTSQMLLPVVLPLRCEGCGCGGAGGRLMRCARCRLVHYCSRACQRAHHASHAPACRRVVRAVRQMLEADALRVRAPAQHAPANGRPCP